MIEFEHISTNKGTGYGNHGIGSMYQHLNVQTVMPFVAVCLKAGYSVEIRVDTKKHTEADIRKEMKQWENDINKDTRHTPSVKIEENLVEGMPNVFWIIRIVT